MGCLGQPGAVRWCRGSGRRSPDGLGAHAERPAGPCVVLGLRAGAPLEDAVQGGPGIAPVVLPAQELSDVPGHGIDPALVLSPTQLVDQVLWQADRELLRCGHTSVIPVAVGASQPDRPCWPGGATPRNPPVAQGPVPSSRSLGPAGPGERPPACSGRAVV